MAHCNGYLLAGNDEAVVSTLTQVIVPMFSPQPIAGPIVQSFYLRIWRDAKTSQRLSSPSFQAGEYMRLEVESRLPWR
jgi:hypothetical protein